MQIEKLTGELEGAYEGYLHRNDLSLNCYSIKFKRFLSAFLGREAEYWLAMEADAWPACCP